MIYAQTTIDGILYNVIATLADDGDIDFNLELA